MSDKAVERDLLARIRTLLALERNYLAEERTQLAKLRTGIALLLIVPPLYFLSISLQNIISFLMVILIYIFLFISAGCSMWLIAKSRSTLKKIRVKKKKVKETINKIVKNSEIASRILGDCMYFEE